MRSFVRHGLVIGTCLGAMLASAGCEQKKATEYVTGVSTQVTVPKYLRAVRINISADGFPSFCQSYRVYDGKVLLPRSLGNFPSSSDGNSRHITFSIVGLTDDYRPDSANQVFSDCYSSPKIGDNSVRILRRSTQPYVPDHIKFLPMALKYSCFDKDCPDEGTSCRGGVCVKDELNQEQANALTDYTDGQGEGTDGACFSMPVCMGAAIPAVPVNVDTCDFAVAESEDAKKIAIIPPDKNPFRPACTTTDQCSGRPCNNGQCDLLPAGSPPWTGVNVEITYDGAGTKEILDLDATEGFTIPDATKPQTFHLADGLCQMLKGKDKEGKPTAHRITSIRAAGTCVPKLASQSICQADQLKIMGAKDDGSADKIDPLKCETHLLTRSKSALVLVVDHTAKHQPFFKAEVQDALKAPLEDPAFESTDIAVMYADSTSVCGGAAMTVPLTPALPDGANNIISKFKSDEGSATDPGDPKFEGAMQSAYDLLGGLDASYARRAVVVLGNRKFNENTCGPDKTPAELAAAQLALPSKSVATFAVRVTNSTDANAEVDPSSSVRTLAAAGYPLGPGGLTVYEPQATKVEDKKRALQEVINDLATCLYDANPAPTADATLTYADPLRAAEVKIAPLPAGTTSCSADVNQEGWFTDNTDAAHPRVKICGKSCTDYRKVLSDTSTFTILYNQPSIPVPLYWNSADCYKVVP